MKLLDLFCTLMCLFHTSMAAFGPKRLYTMDLATTPVSVKVVGKDLIIVGPWYIGSITNIHWKFRQSSRMKPRVINKDIPNPRSVGRIPSNAFKGSNGITYWVASWGANETSGAMYVMKPTATYSVWKDIAIDAGWNYERAQWIDMDRDGRTDCLTARYRGGVGQLLWFQQPSGQEKWGQQIIHEGMADGNFIGFYKGKKTYILVAGLQFSTLGLYWTMSRTNLWSTSRMVRHRVIDNYGKFYDVQYIDLNKDGRPDALTTTVNVGNARGHVLGYEIPDDIQNKIWKRRVLAAQFKGDYSPGKAKAFWPNKWKRKTDRPSVFLSGAGQEELIILTPKPARSGWGYVKSTLKAGTGMIGIPYIGDIDGDSYPEVFVPQGDKLHVFSYDYNAAVAEPPNTKASAGKVTPRPVVKYRPAFFRPTPTTLPPLIPRGAPNLGLNAGSLSGNAASQFGSSGILPSGDASPATVAPLGNLPPLQTRGGGSSSSARRPSPNLPAISRTNIAPVNGGGSSAGNTGGVSPVLPGSGSRGSAGNTGGGASSSATGGSTGYSNNFGNSQVFTPVLTNNGVVFAPVQNTPPLQRNPSVGNTAQTGNIPVAPVPQNNQVIPYSPNVSPGGGSSLFNPNQGSSSFTGGSTGSNNNFNNGQVVNNGAAYVPAQNPFDGNTPVNNEIAPQNDQDAQIIPFDPQGDGQNIIPINNQPVFEDEYYYYEEDYQPILEKPPNTMLSLTLDKYKYREEAEVACTFEKKALCSLQQLQSAKKSGIIPLIEWGWFDMENSAAEMTDCKPGEVKWEGYKCYNGVGYTKIYEATQLKGYCCSVLIGAEITDKKFSNLEAAEEGCKQLNSHICSIEEMYDVWEKSSLKDTPWGWHKDAGNLIKMVYDCEPDNPKWPGYQCHSRRLTTSKINVFLQESAFCCKKNSGLKLLIQFNSLFLVLIVSFYNLF